MILVDTSVWINHFRGEVTPETDFLSKALEANEDVCISGIVLTEILQGVRQDKEYKLVRSSLEELILLPMSNQAYYLAADIYRRARFQGETIRNTMDCLIAACAVIHHVPLLQRDKDYETIAKFSKLRLVEVKGD